MNGLRNRDMLSAGKEAESKMEKDAIPADNVLYLQPLKMKK